MSKVAKAVCLMILALTVGLVNVSAEESLPPKLQQLTDEAYRCYSARETDSYFEVVKKVKDATEFSQYQETYYRACSYEAISDIHGKALFVYTDGINEAENIHKEQFGDERLRALLKQDLGDARQTSETIHKAVKDFVGDAEIPFFSSILHCLYFRS